MGSHCFLQGIFPTQGSDPCLPHWQADSLPLSHQGSPAFQTNSNMTCRSSEQMLEAGQSDQHVCMCAHTDRHRHRHTDTQTQTQTQTHRHTDTQTHTHTHTHHLHPVAQEDQTREGKHSHAISPVLPARLRRFIRNSTAPPAVHAVYCVHLSEDAVSVSLFRSQLSVASQPEASTG